MPKNKKIEYVYAVGRRKTSVARVRLYKGKGETTVNGHPIQEYFPGEIFKNTWTRPFKETQTVDNYYATVKVKGGGKKSQLEATVHGISKALALVDEGKFRKPLKKAGLLTRDSRMRERRKADTGGKARREKQSPKR